MRIRVVGRSAAEPRSVVFASEFGGGAGYWNAGGEPVVGGWYHVELDAPEEVAHWSHATTGDPTGFSATGDGDGVTVCGAVEDVLPGEVPVVTLRIGDSLVTIDLKRGSGDSGHPRHPGDPGRPGDPGDPGQPSVRDVIRFEIPRVELWPYEL